MIGRLRGELLEIDGSVATVDCCGVGYEVNVPETVTLALGEVGSQVEIWVRQVFREDSVSLYGFLSAYQRKVFDLLTEVKGCGPKIGLALIGQVGEHSTVSSIVSGDARSLARATGVGMRLAERIILELKDKAAELSLLHRADSAAAYVPTRGSADSELVEALLGLGYRRSEAEAAASAVGESDSPLEDRLVIALRSLSR